MLRTVSIANHVFDYEHDVAAATAGGRCASAFKLGDE